MPCPISRFSVPDQAEKICLFTKVQTGKQRMYICFEKEYRI